MYLRDDFSILRPKGPRVVVGVDVGQKHDPTAIVVAEYLKRPRDDNPAKEEWYFPIRHMERLSLGTPYPDVAVRVVAIVRNLKARAVPPAKIDVVVDSTGVGTPVVDILRVPLKEERIRVSEATFTFGRSLKGEVGGWVTMTVGKEHLVSRLQSLFTTRRVQLPTNNSEAQAMARELQDYEIRTDPDGDAKFGAFRTGTHDDLVTALGLAVLHDPVSRGGGVPR